MALNPIKNLTENISGAFDNIAGAFGFGQTIAKYPGGFDEYINSIDITSKDWKESLGYEFQVMIEGESFAGLLNSVAAGGKRKGTPLKDANGWKPLRLQINPQELGQDEIFAIQVTPTFKGIMVEHQGVTLRDIVIAGTTGISPKRGQGGALSTGAPAFGKGHSGYAEFHELRNYFRVYAEQKRRPGNEKLRMVFRNFKDREYLIVEPQKFKLKRTSAKSMLYNYTIEMKGIGREDFNPSAGDWSDKLFGFLDRVATGFEDAARVFQGALGFIQGVKSDFATALLGPLLRITESVRTMLETGQQIIDETRTPLSEFKAQWEELERNINDLLGKDSQTWNETTGHTSTIVGQSGRESTYQELQVLNAIQKVKRGLALLLQDNRIFQEDATASYTSTVEIYSNKIALPAPKAVKEVRIDGNDSLQTLVARELGDPQRFKEVVLLNNLKPPYISETGGERVLKPGDKILLPQESSNQLTGTTRNKEYNITKNLSETEKNFGVDIALTKDNDIALSNTGDMDLVAGFDNLAQAINLKLFINKGGLKMHPQIGAGLGVGEKALNPADLKRDIDTSVALDPRIDNIPFSSVDQNGNETNIKLILNVKDVDQPVPIPLRL